MTRPGFTLPLVLLVVVALELLTLSTLTLATHERLNTTAQQRAAQARRRAQAALQDLQAHWPDSLDHLAIGEQQTWSRADSVQISLERVGWGSFYASAAAPAGQSAIRVSALLRTLDAERAFAELRGALITAGGVVIENAFITAEDTTSCTLPFGSTRVPHAITVARITDLPLTDDAIVDSALAHHPDDYAIGGLTWNEIASVADTVINGVVDLGDAESPTSPLLIYSPGPLTLRSGSAHGLLFVNGNLQIDDAAFAGAIIVRGMVYANQAAQIFGSLRIKGIAPSLVSNHLRYSQCAVGMALVHSPGAGRLARGGRRYLPTF